MYYVSYAMLIHTIVIPPYIYTPSQIHYQAISLQ